MAPRHKAKSNSIHRNRLVATYKPSVKAKSNNQSLPAKEESIEDFFKNLPVKVQTGLGDNIDKYVALSPTLTRQIQEIQKRNWTIIWSNKAGNKTLWDLQKNSGNIFINESLSHGINGYSLDEQYKMKYLISIIAHEVGHAFNYTPPDPSSYKACMQSLISGPGSEGNAAYNSVIIRQEILMNTHNKIDIFLNSGELREKMVSYIQIVENNSPKDAMNKLGITFLPEHQSLEGGKTYEEAYGDVCKQFDKKK